MDAGRRQSPVLQLIGLRFEQVAAPFDLRLTQQVKLLFYFLFHFFILFLLKEVLRKSIMGINIKSLLNQELLLLC